MADFVWILLLLCLLSVGLGVLGVRLSPNRLAPWFLGLGTIGALFYAVALYDRLFIVRLIPFPVLGLIAGNCMLLPVTVGLAALAVPRLTGSLLRRLTLSALLVLGGAWHALSPFAGSPPETNNMPVGNDGVVRQTSESSCSAASAATILNHAGITATETEMAYLSLTRSTGTPMMGVYRGLRRKTENTPWRVSVLSQATMNDMRLASQHGPVLISVGLDRWQRGYDPRYVTDWGWTPGKRHAVVLFGFLPNGKLDIGDPSIGREKWNAEALSVLWNGEGIQLRSQGVP